jgi:hypothetical protein
MSLFKIIVYSYVGLIALSFWIVPVNNVGIINRFSSLYVQHPGIRLKIPFIDSVVPIHTGYDTDFTTNIQCFSRDNVLLKFPKFYIDNQFNCNTKDSSCFIDIYKKYFLSDSKAKAKFISFNKLVPEDGMIFKHIHDTMAVACKTITAYQSQKDWHLMYPVILKSLREKVPPGIQIISVRTDRPEINNRDWILSIPGVITYTTYMQTINIINGFNNLIDYISNL